MRVMGIDPGIGRTGIGVVEGDNENLSLVYAACIETFPSEKIEGIRLMQLSAGLRKVLKEHKPEVAVVERLFFASNQTTAMRVSQARGIVLYEIARAKVPLIEYTPLQIKQTVSGSGNTKKKELSKVTCAILNVESFNGPDDIDDACAIAICHFRKLALAALLAEEAVAVPVIEDIKPVIKIKEVKPKVKKVSKVL